MKASLKLISLGLVLAVAGSAMASGTAAAKTLIANASATAAKEHKNVLLIFHASWCGWCKKLDAMLETPQYKKIFENSFVITHLDCLEQPKQKGLENEGAEDLLNQFGGKDQGIPFMVFLTPDGKQLATSMYDTPKGKTNMGFPAEPQEVAAFKAILEKAGTHMNAKDIRVVEKYLKNPPKK